MGVISKAHPGIGEKLYVKGGGITHILLYLTLWRTDLKIHPPHSRDFRRELGGWALCVLRGFLCSDDQKVLSAKMPSGNTFHTDGVTIFGKETAA